MILSKVRNISGRCEQASENETRYRQHRNILTQVLRDAKRNYYANSFETNKNDGKKTWTLLNEVMNKKTDKDSLYPTTFYDNNTELSTTDEIANGFNTFFSEIGTKLERNIPKTKKNQL